MLRHLNDIEVPVTGVVNGLATFHPEIPIMGGIVLASHDAVFADPLHFPFRDTIPGDGVQLIWGELLGPTRAKYWLLTGATIDSQEALRIGFVNEVHKRSDLEARAWELAEDLGRRSVPALRYAKAVIGMGSRQEFTKALGYGLALEGGGYMAKGAEELGLGRVSIRPGHPHRRSRRHAERHLRTLADADHYQPVEKAMLHHGDRHIRVDSTGSQVAWEL